MRGGRREGGDGWWRRAGATKVGSARELRSGRKAEGLDSQRCVGTLLTIPCGRLTTSVPSRPSPMEEEDADDEAVVRGWRRMEEGSSS